MKEYQLNKSTGEVEPIPENETRQIDIDVDMPGEWKVESEKLKELERITTLKVAEICANMCGSQADQKNIRKHFGLDYEDAPTHYQDLRYQETQYQWSKHYIKENKQ